MRVYHQSPPFRGSERDRTYVRGQIWIVNLDLTIGHEQANQRPALVLSADSRRMREAQMVTIVPITSNLRAVVPAHVPIEPGEGGLRLAGHILADQVRTVSTKRLLRCTGQASGRTVAQVAAVVKEMLGLH